MSESRWWLSQPLRSVVIAVGCFASLCIFPVRGANIASAEEQPSTTASTDPRTDGQPDEIDRAVDRSIAFMLKYQKESGWINHEAKFETAITSLALMAMASAGHQTTDSTHEGLAMRRALAYVLREDRQQPDGYFGQADASRMYGHGIATLMLTELLGMAVDKDQDKLIREKCQRAVDLILRAQNVQKRPEFVGGWRYLPDSVDADMSVTIWQVMALRSAHNAGLEVPSEAIDKAVAYIKNSYKKVEKENPNPLFHSGFSYVPNPRPGVDPLSPPLQAAGVLALQVCGRYDEHEIAPTIEWLTEKKPPVWHPYHGMVIYNLYYYNQTLHQCGDKYADIGHGITRDLLLKHQLEDGSWESPSLHERSQGPVGQTAFATLALTVKYKYLPIYQQ